MEKLAWTAIDQRYSQFIHVWRFIRRIVKIVTIWNTNSGLIFCVYLMVSVTIHLGVCLKEIQPWQQQPVHKNCHPFSHVDYRCGGKGETLSCPTGVACPMDTHNITCGSCSRVFVVLKSLHLVLFSVGIHYAWNLSSHPVFGQRFVSGR